MTSTRVVLPFTFETTILPPRHRNRDHVTILDFAHVDIPEVDPSDAPVVVLERPRPEWDPSVSDLEFRHDGRTFLRPAALDGRHFSERLDAASFAAGLCGNPGRPVPHYPTVVRTNDSDAALHAGKILIGPQPDLREDPEIRERETASFVRRASEAFTTVNGVLFVRCPEPVVECRHGWDGVYANRIVTARKAEPHARECAFHLPLDLDRLVATGMDVDSLSRVEILDQGRIPDDPRPYLAEFAIGHVEAILEEGKPSTSSAHDVAWWLSVLRILEAAGHDGSTPDLGVMVNEISGLGRLTEATGFRSDSLKRLLEIAAVHVRYAAGSRFDARADDMLSLAGMEMR